MGRLRPEKLHVSYLPGVTHEAPTMPRRYTLTHSDLTGDLFLSVGSDYNRKQISGLYTRVMRDEVLAEWKEDEVGISLHVYCHVSGGVVIGSAGWRYGIFKKELPLVLEIFRFGDMGLFKVNPELDKSPVLVHFHSTKQMYDKFENWGIPADYEINK